MDLSAAPDGTPTTSLPCCGRAHRWMAGGALGLLPQPVHGM
ncbi:hypothetical protein ACN9JG_20960 (plasmid) [Cereibacter azotoformans]|uniref:Uncharacterized protein n=1 Tax=Cereibacter azotoformans TaxID=43057 RepID=A0A2T5JTC1_9RHOB|nr:hypothetical protein [Cereibacter azotoformans]PTR13413.1 hypothetical protein C8J28_12243 [Cereibacter azotoformans]